MIKSFCCIFPARRAIIDKLTGMQQSVPTDRVQSVIFRKVKIMKEGIHPDYQQTTIRCACGAVYPTGSTKQDIRVEVCAKCHPFFTGKQKVLDTGGRVSRFNKKYGLGK